MADFWGDLADRIKKESRIYQKTNEKIVQPVSEVVQDVKQTVENVKKTVGNPSTWLMIGGGILFIILIFRR